MNTNRDGISQEIIDEGVAVIQAAALFSTGQYSDAETVIRAAVEKLEYLFNKKVPSLKKSNSL